MTALLLALFLGADPDRYFAIQVVDEQTNRGVPLVELRTTNHVRFVTDSNGYVSFDEPGLMNTRVFFHVASHGYELAKDGFGNRGKSFEVGPGGSATIKIKRKNIAERIYRITGAGIYRDSVLLDKPTPIQSPVINALVFGSDSTVNAVFQAKYLWFWGDTNRPAYPLGNFHVPGATSRLPKDGGLDPERGVELEYLIGNDGFARPTAQLPGEGPTWIGGATVLKDGDRERLFAGYLKVRPPMTVYERGVAEFDAATKSFHKVRAFPLNEGAHPNGHTFLHTTDGVPYVYFADPYPFTRVKATPADFCRPEAYETYTCMKRGADALERDANGRAVFSWTRNAKPFDEPLQQKLAKGGALKPEELLFRLRDVNSGAAVTAHRGSISWNAFRQRWVMITTQIYGTSVLGEVWYSEARDFMGPWTSAKKVVTHDKYSFYNPKQHPVFAKDNGRFIFFEGTYTTTFSGNTDPTPRYDYNQIMYKLDLADPRLRIGDGRK